MKYMLLINQGETPVPGTPEWDNLSEDERTRIPPTTRRSTRRRG